MTNTLYAREITRHVLALRESLVRFDENEKAYRLLAECTPYFLADDPEITAALADQREMVAHLLDPEEYRRYYAENPHERPFETQYGLPVEQAHKIPRIAFLRGELAAMHSGSSKDLRVLDLGANDGFMAANIGALGYVETDCVDLHPGNCELARDRRLRGAAIGSVYKRDAMETITLGGPDRNAYDAVVAFELIEHVPDPRRLLEAMREYAAPDGKLYVSTPEGAVERGDLPTWAHVERKGHVRSMTERDLRAVCETAGEVERMVRGPDGVMVAVVSPAG